MATRGSRAASAVVFDLDGTLVDSLDLVTHAYLGTIAAYGGPRISRTDLEAVWHIGPTPTIIEHFLARPAPEAVGHFQRVIREGSMSLSPFPGVMKLLTGLASDRVELGVVTNASRVNAEAVLAATGIGPLIAVTVCADEADPKPSPSGLLAALAALGAAPERSTYIGDSWVDLACARAAGVAGVHAGWGQPRGCRLAAQHECAFTVDALRNTLAKGLSAAP